MEKKGKLQKWNKNENRNDKQWKEEKTETKDRNK